ncbi:hypothetical protein [Absidia glauca]|uniref:Reverse transcriptase/retrotransposon-derived protein RNase H-like domain-containing protein n=1 Tax=Absidia glauca TaxID=4829 RepID=A0A163IYJ4_ABSGL|nr:hypothetical protein [Absidia glauca]
MRRARQHKADKQERHHPYKQKAQQRGKAKMISNKSSNPCTRCGRQYFEGHACNCQYCKKAWTPGHTCKEYLQAKSDKYLSRMATLHAETAMQDVDEEDLECKSAHEKRKLEECTLTRDSFIVPIILKDIDHATSFIDDIVVFSQDINEHATHVQSVIEKLTELFLILNPDKCHFAQRSVNLLGFCVSDQGLTLDTRKVTNVQSWPRPQTGNEIEKFLGVINYFRNHIPMISNLTAPLDKLRKHKSLKNDWDDLCETAFVEKLKRILTCTPVLKYPKVNEPYYVATDASDVGIGAVLFQMIENKIQHIGFFAR